MAFGLGPGDVCWWQREGSTGDNGNPGTYILRTDVLERWKGKEYFLKGCGWRSGWSQVRKSPELQLQHQSFQWIFRVAFLQDWLVWFPCCPRDFQESLFKSIDSLALSLLYGPSLTTVHDNWKTIALTMRTFVGKVMPLLFNMLSRFVIDFLSTFTCPSWIAAMTTVQGVASGVRAGQVSLVLESVFISKSLGVMLAFVWTLSQICITFSLKSPSEISWLHALCLYSFVVLALGYNSMSLLNLLGKANPAIQIVGLTIFFSFV